MGIGISSLYTFEAVGNRVKEIYKNSKQEMNIIDTLDKRERWVANYIITNNKIRAKVGNISLGNF